MDHVRTEDPAEYAVDQIANEERIIAQALVILERRLAVPGEAISSPNDTRAFLRLKLAAREWETFSILFLDNRHRMIEFSELFRGTIDGASVPAREVVRDCINKNAAAVILAHNHPSGVATPSNADQALTRRLVDALSLIDVRVLDHVIVGGDVTEDLYSFAEHGLL